MRVRVDHPGAACAPPAHHGVDAFVTSRAPAITTSAAPLTRARRQRRGLTDDFSEDRAAIFQDDARQHVSGSALEFRRRQLDSECVGAAATQRACFAGFVFPVILPKEHHVDAPNHDRAVGFDRHRRINEVSPDDVPSRMIVVGLDRPSSRTALRLQRQLGRRVELPAKG